MSIKQGVGKRDFFWPLQQAITTRLRGAAVSPTATYESLILTSAITGLPTPTIPSPKPVPILDFAGVRKGTNPPYVTVGDVPSMVNADTKGGSAEEISHQIHIWSRYNGMYEVAFIGDQVLKLLTQYPLDMSAQSFNIISLRKEMDQCLFDRSFSHRVIRLRIMVEDLGLLQPINF